MNKYYLWVTLQLLLQLGLPQRLCHQWSFFQAFPTHMGRRQVVCNFTVYFYFIKLAEDPSRADENCSNCLMHLSQHFPHLLKLLSISNNTIYIHTLYIHYIYHFYCTSLKVSSQQQMQEKILRGQESLLRLFKKRWTY